MKNRFQQQFVRSCILAAAFVLTSVLAPSAQAALRCVPGAIAGQTCTFTHATISAAVAAASGGDTIMVDVGTYSENVSLGSNLTLTAAPGTKPIIDGGSSGDAVSVSGTGITVNGFEIRNGWSGIQGGGDLVIHFHEQRHPRQSEPPRLCWRWHLTVG